MVPRLLADLVVTVHALFVLWVVLGGFLVWRYPRLIWVHIPSLAWGVLLESEALICPLTYLENWLRARAHEQGYAGGFLTHYLLSALYPAGLTPSIQMLLAAGLLILNLGIYGVWLRWLRRTP